MSSKNGTIKISQKLAEIFDHMDYISNCHKNISEVVKEQFELIQRELNPDNALGAGDCFAASFLHATVVDSLQTDDALVFATQNTSLVLRSSTALPNMP